MMSTTFNDLPKCTVVLFLVLAFLTSGISAVNIRRIQNTVDIRSRAFDTMLAGLQEVPAPNVTNTESGAVVNGSNSTNPPLKPLIGAPDATVNQTPATNTSTNGSEKHEEHDYFEKNTCLGLYEHALKACKEKSADDKESKVCVQWAMASNARCLHSCYVQTETCGVEVRDHVRILTAFKSHCKGDLCKEFAGEEASILAEFANCFTRKPACEDPQVVAFNFFRFGGRAYNEADKKVVPAVKLSKFLNAGNATEDILQKLYKCSYDAKCVAKHSKELESKKGDHNKDDEDNKDKKHDEKEQKPASPVTPASGPLVPPNSTTPLPPVTTNATNTTNTTLIQLPVNEGESYMQIACRFVKSLFS